jgi:phosphoribosyl-ATP pyrophosphohydrolase
MSKTLSLDELFSLIKNKIAAKEKNSYTYEIAKGGAEKITRKVGEEAVEVVIAAFMNEQKNNKETRQDLIGEVSDLFYHTLVLLASQNIELDEILQELNKRNQSKK